MLGFEYRIWGFVICPPIHVVVGTVNLKHMLYLLPFTGAQEKTALYTRTMGTMPMAFPKGGPLVPPGGLIWSIPRHRKGN